MRTVVLQRAEHQISRKNIDSTAKKVLYRLYRKGFKAYLVGGSVRDLLLGRKPKDFDIGTDAKPHQVRKLFRNCFLIGRRFRLAHIKFGDEIIEVSTFRRSCSVVEEDGSVQLVKQDNLYGTPYEDALRRDFTINGIFYNIADFSVIDYVGGLEDLSKKIVRTIGAPEVRFQEDPVRMIRAIRVAARLGFTIHEDTLNAIKKHHAATLQCSEMRNLEEILTLLRYRCAHESLKLFEEVGLAEILLPELHEFLRLLNEKQLDQDAYYWRFLQALDRIEHTKGELTMPVLVGVYFLPLIRYYVEMPEYEGTAVDGEITQIVQDQVAPFVKRLCFPKRQLDRLIQILVFQRKYWSIGKKRFKPNSILKRSYFEDGFLLFKISVMALNKGDNLVKLWEERRHQEAECNRQPELPKRSRKRSRHKKRTKSPELNVNPGTVETVNPETSAQ